MGRISLEEYTIAVKSCIKLAQQPTGSGRVAAQVILSAHNGDYFQLDVASLAYLDFHNYETALTVIRGRYETNREPHEMIEDGNIILRELWQQWKQLEIVERSKRMCPDCDGSGTLYINPKDENDMRTEPCVRCSGQGRVCRCS